MAALTGLWNRFVLEENRRLTSLRRKNLIVRHKTRELGKKPTFTLDSTYVEFMSSLPPGVSEQWAQRRDLSMKYFIFAFKRSLRSTALFSVPILPVYYVWLTRWTESRDRRYFWLTSACFGVFACPLFMEMAVSARPDGAVAKLVRNRTTILGPLLCYIWFLGCILFINPTLEEVYDLREREYLLRVRRGENNAAIADQKFSEGPRKNENATKNQSDAALSAVGGGSEIESSSSPVSKKERTVLVEQTPPGLPVLVTDTAGTDSESVLSGPELLEGKALALYTDSESTVESYHENRSSDAFRSWWR